MCHIIDGIEINWSLIQLIFFNLLLQYIPPYTSCISQHWVRRGERRGGFLRGPCDFRVCSCCRQVFELSCSVSVAMATLVALALGPALRSAACLVAASTSLSSAPAPECASIFSRSTSNSFAVESRGSLRALLLAGVQNSSPSTLSESRPIPYLLFRWIYRNFTSGRYLILCLLFRILLFLSFREFSVDRG